jgi:N-hydroxyarylamine O-acetyltransferase
MMLDVAAYLARIAYDDPVQPDWATLRALQLAHLRTVPFENLDIHLGRTILLEQDHLFHKIVRQRRGGFCYELNGLFAMLLREIGFTVTMLGARFPRDDDLPAPELDHLTLLVRCRDRQYPVIADVAAGRGSFPTPLRIDTDEAQPQPEVSSVFRIQAEQDKYQLWRQPDGGDWEREYQFDLQPREFAEFQAGCEFHQTSPHSPFTQNRLCTILTPTGRITLSGNTLITTANGVRSECELDAAGQQQALRDHFAIDLDHGR